MMRGFRKTARKLPLPGEDRRLKFLLLGILRKMGQSKRSKHQNTTRNKHYIMAKSRRFCRGLQRILRVKKWRRSENFDKVGILRICGVTARSHIRLPTSTFTRYNLKFLSLSKISRIYR